HAFGVYSSEPPTKPFQHQDVQAEVDAMPTRDLESGFMGNARIEGYVVMYGKDGFDAAWAGLLTERGTRTWAMTRDQDMMVDMTRNEYVGRTARVNAEHQFSI
ncbi:MAG: hypothetical protein KDE20_23035, partial [Caldilineaceae bacterium]|nr:hypothetical protein [Caldilineaceae bacterium]